MFRGTTPTLQFQLPLYPDTLENLYITIAQQGQPVLEKQLRDCQTDGMTVTCRLTQADTLALRPSMDAQIQLRARTLAGDALASRIISCRVDRILKDGEI